MKRSLLGLLAAIAGLAGLAACWLGKKTLETLLGEVFKRAVDRAGRPGWGLLFLGCGLSLVIAGPVLMARENRQRVTTGKKPRYGGVEFGVVIVGGVAFTLAGAATLLGYW